MLPWDNIQLPAGYCSKICLAQYDFGLRNKIDELKPEGSHLSVVYQSKPVLALRGLIFLM